MPAFSASLFKNDRKESERQPDFTGPGNVSKEDFMAIADAVTSGRIKTDDRGDVQLRIAGWKRESKGGRSYISLQLSLDDYGLDAAPAKAAAAPSESIEDLF
jgi:hypothetical protein